MIYDAPIAYELTFIPPRSSKPKTLAVWDTTPVTVEACPGSDAPVAVRARRSDDGAEVDYRLHNGRLWQPVREIDPNVGSAPIATENTRNPLVHRESWLRRADVEVKPLHDVMFKEVVRSDRQTTAAIANARAADLLLIDGCLHEVSVGPVFCLRPIENGKRVEVVSTDIYSIDQSFSAGLIFRADQRENALAMASRLAPKKSPQVSADAVQMFIPTALDMDAIATSAIQLGKKVFSSGTAKMTIGSMPTDYLEAWLEYTSPGFPQTRLSDDLLNVLTKAGRALKETRDGANLGKEVDAFVSRLEMEFAPVEAPALTA